MRATSFYSCLDRRARAPGSQRRLGQYQSRESRTTYGGLPGPGAVSSRILARAGWGRSSSTSDPRATPPTAASRSIGLSPSPAAATSRGPKRIPTSLCLSSSGSERWPPRRGASVVGWHPIVIPLSRAGWIPGSRVAWYATPFTGASSRGEPTVIRSESGVGGLRGLEADGHMAENAMISNPKISPQVHPRFIYAITA